MVGRVDHDGIFAQAQGVHLIEQRAQQLVRRAQAGQVVAEVVPRLGRVDDGRRREHEVLLDVVVFLIDQERAVHAEGQKERLVAVAPAAQEVERVGKRRQIALAGGRGALGEALVIAEHAVVLRLMLHAGEDRVIAVVVQVVGEVLVVVVHVEAAVRQAEHARAVRGHAGEHAHAAA